MAGTILQGLMQGLLQGMEVSQSREAHQAKMQQAKDDGTMRQLQMQKMLAEQDKLENIRNIMFASKTEDGIDHSQAIGKLEQAGYLDEADKVRQSMSQANKDSDSMQKLLAETEESQMDLLIKQQDYVSSRFGGIQSLTDVMLPRVYQAALQDSEELLPAGLFDAAQSAKTPAEMRAMANQIWFATGKFSAQARYEIDKGKMVAAQQIAKDKAETISSDKYTTKLLQQTVANRQAGLPPKFGMTEEQVQALDKKFGPNYLDKALTLSMVNPAFAKTMMKDPTAGTKMLVDTAKTLQAIQQGTKAQELKQQQQKPGDQISGAEIQKIAKLLKAKGKTLEDFKAYAKKAKLTQRQAYEALMKRLEGKQ